MKVTVCELANDPAALEADWARLVEHVRAEASELVVLPEMPFFRWLAGSREVDPDQWRESVSAHDAWWPRLAELGAERIVGTRPIVDGGRNYNEAFAWTREPDTCIAAHRKRYLPEEEGFWESSWYAAGDGDAKVVDAAGVRIGFAICTEIWFHGHARTCVREAAHVIASPRATMAASTDKWIAGGRTAAVVSGAFSLSSNFRGPAGALGRWGGTGWIIDPEEGDVLGTTSPERPFLTLDVDLARADAAKRTYPRYVPD